MKNIITFIFCLLLVGTVGISAFAAGVDDGVLSVADINGAKFFGNAVSNNVVKYTAANGSGEYFYDLNADKIMNVCDLVSLHINEADMDADNSFTAKDAEFLRLMLIGNI